MEHKAPTSPHVVQRCRVLTNKNAQESITITTTDTVFLSFPSPSPSSPSSVFLVCQSPNSFAIEGAPASASLPGRPVQQQKLNCLSQGTSYIALLVAVEDQIGDRRDPLSLGLLKI